MLDRLYHRPLIHEPHCDIGGLRCSDACGSDHHVRAGLRAIDTAGATFAYRPVKRQGCREGALQV
jgi:hypothetical protein